MDSSLTLLRHTVATLAYRGGKAVRGASADFAGFRAMPNSRTPAEILAHIGDLLDWTLQMADGRHAWHDSKPLEWEQESARFLLPCKHWMIAWPPVLRLDFRPERFSRARLPMR